MKVFSPFLNGNTTTSGSFNVPNHPGTGSIPNPLTGSLFHDDTDGILKVYTGTQWQVVGEQTGPAPASPDIEYLLVAGGGAGGGGNYNSGGGGAGGYLSSSLASVTSGSSFTVTVGSGGTGAATQGTEGTNSTIAGASISTITATGGGGGGSHSDNPYSGTDGGSGGGGTQGGGAGGSGTVGQGNNGTGLWYGTGGGGGGAGEAGTVGEGNVPPYTRGSQSDIDGGDGLQSNITGILTYRAGGGGGGQRTALSVVRGNGGAGGGGQGGPDPGAGSAGTANTGGGGGGSGGNDTNTRSGGSGGSGVAIFAYPTGSINGAGGITGTTSSGNKYNQFNSSGTLTLGGASDFQIVTDSLGLHVDAGNFSSRGTSTATDLSGNGNNMTVTGATLNNNFYYSISSTSTYLTCASDASIKSTTALTLEAWVRITDLTNQWKPIFSKGSSDSTEDYILMIRPGNNVVYLDCGGGSLYAQPSFTWASNTWYHIVATHSKPSGTSTMGITINNSALSVTTNGATGTAGNNSDALYIGTARNNSIGGTGIEIAQARVYTKVLTASEITQNYNATKTNFI